MSSSSLWMLRHGSSQSNEGGPTADAWLIPITPKGEVQCREAAQHWSKLIAPRAFCVRP